MNNESEDLYEDARILQLQNFELPSTLPDDDHYVTFHWGLKGVDMDDGWVPIESGQVVFDSNFTISSVENQEALLAFCNQLQDSLDDNKEDTHDKVNCWLRDFDEFL